MCSPLSQAGVDPAKAAREWCKKQTLHYLVKRGYAPYTWTATTITEGANFVTEAEWRVDADNIKVHCTSKNGLPTISGTYKILNIEILDEEYAETPEEIPAGRR